MQHSMSNGEIGPGRRKGKTEDKDDKRRGRDSRGEAKKRSAWSQVGPVTECASLNILI